VLFWATWCPYCKALMPHVQSNLDEYGKQVRVVAPFWAARLREALDQLIQQER
jgi:hypothetical protein